jgi:septal ring factor EnvC (AmiA/AmiB activator)
MTDEPVNNTDKEIWREVPDDYYSPSICVTAFNSIAINVGGHVFAYGVRTWHKLAMEDHERKQQLAQVTQERDNIAKAYGKLTHEAEHYKTLSERLEKELAQAKHDLQNHLHLDNHNAIVRQLNQHLHEAQQREARRRDALDRIIHVADGKPAYQGFANEAKAALSTHPTTGAHRGTQE